MNRQSFLLPPNMAARIRAAMAGFPWVQVDHPTYVNKGKRYPYSSKRQRLGGRVNRMGGKRA